jgi:hypothetical protein
MYAGRLQDLKHRTCTALYHVVRPIIDRQEPDLDKPEKDSVGLFLYTSLVIAFLYVILRYIR